MRKVMGEWQRQHTCPKCGMTGAGTPLPPLPLCHSRECNFKTKMLPSHNGAILEDWDTVLVEEAVIIYKEREEKRRVAADRA